MEANPSRRCLGYTRDGKRCRTRVNGSKNDLFNTLMLDDKKNAEEALSEFYCCNAHMPANIHAVLDDGCIICGADYNVLANDVVHLQCRHVFHRPCLSNWFAMSIKKTCPMCRSISTRCLQIVKEGGHACIFVYYFIRFLHIPKCIV